RYHQRRLSIEETVCFICNRKGHKARVCAERRDTSREGNFEGIKVKSCERKSTIGVIKESKVEVNALEDGKTWLSNVNKRSRIVNKLEVLVKDYPEVFSEGSERVKYLTGVKCKIATKQGEKVVKKGQIVDYCLREPFKKYLDELESRGVIRRSKSEWRNPIRALQKPNGGIRLVSNLTSLNDLVEKDPYELPLMKDIIRATQGSTIFTVIDLKEGFYHIEIEEAHKHKTAFEYDGRIYEWNSMVMGFKNSPHIMQRAMNIVLDNFRGKGVEVYMDDIVIHAKSSKEHDDLLEEIVKTFKSCGLRINPSKIQYKLEEVKLLGVTINGIDIKPNEIRKQEALEYRKPENVRDLRRFLGLAGWFRDFIPHYAYRTARLTEALKKNTVWNWDEELEHAFNDVKSGLRDIQKLKILEKNKEFRLRTDACDTGLGAILLQTDKEGRWVPVQWASKKLTPTEKRYTISEKEMLAVVFGIKKFESDLRGRKFHLMTDHKALIEIRRKPVFNNNRINRWIEKIQEFDFTVEYVKGELMTDADALSRQFESVAVTEEEKEKTIRKKQRIEKQKQGKVNKHTFIKDGKEFWEFSSGERKEVMPKELREVNILKVHNELNHRGVKGTYYNLKQYWYWPGMKDEISRVIKKCDVCGVNNRKTTGGCEFVATRKKLEKVAIDIMDIGESSRYVLVGIDYYTRKLWGAVIKTKSTKEVLDTLKKWITEDGFPDELITDNGKEFCSEEFEKWCSENDIQHRKVGLEAHRSNGRIERAIRTIRDAFIKQGCGSFEEKITNAIQGYNNTMHSGIKCTPREAWDMDSNTVAIENDAMGDYADKFKKRYREIFVENQAVRIAKRDNLGTLSKTDKGRFRDSGKIMFRCENDSYVVKRVDGKLLKKRHYDLKGMFGVDKGETTRLEEGMLGY
ncbi:MAG: reverse transcriptase domain-containing protein, partial [Clostridium sp.]|uniref:reverse transcriptase family protein n=1 Tax=Clostridium sp. TaxID=1506 RepID=UPI003F2FE64A